MEKIFNLFSCGRSVYQDYCEAMSNLSLGIMELLGMSLGVDKEYFRHFFEANDSVMRLNYYPPCKNPDLALGTGPHCDPTSLTILHQDQVEGLQVLVDGIWHSIVPKEDAFVVNIGDTFMVWFTYLQRFQIPHTKFIIKMLILCYVHCHNVLKIIKHPIDNKKILSYLFTFTYSMKYTWISLLYVGSFLNLRSACFRSLNCSIKK